MNFLTPILSNSRLLLGAFLISRILVSILFRHAIEVQADFEGGNLHLNYHACNDQGQKESVLISQEVIIV